MFREIRFSSLFISQSAAEKIVGTTESFGRTRWQKKHVVIDIDIME